jgi:hypothetical protein
LKDLFFQALAAIIMVAIAAGALALYSGILYVLLHPFFAVSFFDCARIYLGLGVLLVFATGIVKAASGKRD